MANKYFLTEEEEMIRDLAKKFADEVVAPTVTELDQKHAFPEEQIAQLGEMGFLGAEVPEEYGGAGLNCLSHILIMEELARHSSSLASIIDAHAGLGTQPLLKAGTEEQKQKYLVPAAQGQTLCAFALTEPQSGSDSGGTKTTAILDEKTNEMLLRNAQNTVEQSKMTARLASGSSIKTETLEKTWQTIVSGIDETRRIQENARKQRADDQKRLEAIKADFNKRYHMPDTN